MIGNLLYLSNPTRLDIEVTTSMVALHVESPLINNQQGFIKVVKYVKGTQNHGLKIVQEKETS